MNTLAAAGQYLANKPEGLTFAFLLIALVLFVVAAFEGNYWRDRVRTFSLIPIGLAFFVAAFLVHS